MSSSGYFCMSRTVEQFKGLRGSSNLCLNALAWRTCGRLKALDSKETFVLAHHTSTVLASR